MAANDPIEELIDEPELEEDIFEEELPVEEEEEETSADVSDAAPEPAEEVKAEPAEEERHQVPLKTLLSERERHEEDRKRLETQLQRYERLSEQLQRWHAEREAAKVEQVADREPEPPPFEEDPAAHLSARFSQVEKRLQNVDEVVSQEKQRAQQASQADQVLRATRAREVEFVSEGHDDYNDALNHVRSVYYNLYQNLGLSPEDAAEKLRQDELGTAYMALQQGRNPAQVIYDAAKTMGYTRQESPAQTEEQPAGEKDIGKAAKLEQARGMGGGGEPTLDRLEEMGKDEFDQAMEELFGS